MIYIQSEKDKDGCVFCVEMSKPDGLENLIVYRGRQSFVILNRFPYTSGHLMVVPYAHASRLEDLDAESRAEMMELTTHCTEVIGRVYHPQGYNVGVNIGEAAGAGILDHLHMHIVPRWGGDTNFMSSIGGTRVLPEALEDTYRRISEIWEFDERRRA